MNKKKTEKAYDIFYNKYKMLDKYNYVKKVMSSCKTEKQLDNAYSWGYNILWKWFDVMDKEIKKKYGVINGLDFWHYTFNRTSLLTDDLLKYKSELWKEL